MATPPASSLTQTILVVDDVPENLTVLGELLQPYYRVRIANSGVRALQVAASAPKPDLILLEPKGISGCWPTICKITRAFPRC